MSAIQFDRLGIAIEHHNLTMKWQVSAVQIKTVFSLLSYFYGKKVEKPSSVIACARECHLAGTLCNAGLNCQESSEETLLGILC